VVLQCGRPYYLLQKNLRFFENYDMSTRTKRVGGSLDILRSKRVNFYFCNFVLTTFMDIQSMICQKDKIKYSLIDSFIFRVKQTNKNYESDLLAQMEHLNSLKMAEKEEEKRQHEEGMKTEAAYQEKLRQVCFT